MSLVSFLVSSSLQLLIHIHKIRINAIPFPAIGSARAAFIPSIYARISPRTARLQTQTEAVSLLLQLPWPESPGILETHYMEIMLP